MNKRPREPEDIVGTTKLLRLASCSASHSTPDTTDTPPSSIIGYGKDGYVFTVPEHPTLVFKWFRIGTIVNYELQIKLKQIDPLEKRFAIYSFLNMFNDMGELRHIKRQGEGILHAEVNEMVSMRRLIPLDTQKMSLKQYRYLKTSIEILHKNGICHCDLIGNIMLDPDDQLPRIIDWENAKFPMSDVGKYIDIGAFFSTGHFQKGTRVVPWNNAINCDVQR